MAGRYIQIDPRNRVAVPDGAPPHWQAWDRDCWREVAGKADEARAVVDEAPAPAGRRKRGGAATGNEA